MYVRTHKHSLTLNWGGSTENTKNNCWKNIGGTENDGLTKYPNISLVEFEKNISRTSESLDPNSNLSSSIFLNTTRER